MTKPMPTGSSPNASASLTFDDDLALQHHLRSLSSPVPRLQPPFPGRSLQPCPHILMLPSAPSWPLPVLPVKPFPGLEGRARLLFLWVPEYSIPRFRWHRSFWNHLCIFNSFLKAGPLLHSPWQPCGLTPSLSAERRCFRHIPWMNDSFRHCLSAQEKESEPITNYQQSMDSGKWQETELAMAPPHGWTGQSWTPWAPLTTSRKNF